MEHFDAMVRQKCGLLTEEQRAMLKYRHGNAGSPEVGTAGADESGESV